MPGGMRSSPAGSKTTSGGRQRPLELLHRVCCWLGCVMLGPSRQERVVRILAVTDLADRVRAAASL